MLKHATRIVMGDWSGDGHNISSDVFLNCSHSSKELRKAYRASCVKTGLDFSNEVASNYEDNELHSKAIEVFTKFDCPFEQILTDGETDYIHGIDPLDGVELVELQYVRLLMWFISLSLEGLQYEYAKLPTPFNGGGTDLIDGFGYGLYF